MPSLRILNRHGDREVSWSTDALARGDPEAQAAVREAERIFARERSRGAVAFRIVPGARAQRIDVLDPEAEEMIMIPPMVGG